MARNGPITEMIRVRKTSDPTLNTVGSLEVAYEVRRGDVVLESKGLEGLMKPDGKTIDWTRGVETNTSARGGGAAVPADSQSDSAAADADKTGTAADVWEHQPKQKTTKGD